MKILANRLQVTLVPLLSVFAWTVASAQGPQLTSISPTSVIPGTQVTFTGSGFGATQGSGIATFNNKNAGSIVSWSNTQVVATVAAGTLGGLASIKQNGVRSNGVSFTMTPPSLTSISPTSVLPGTQVTFTGSGFGATQGGGTATFNNQVASVVSWSDTQVVATVAAATLGGLASIAQNGVRSNGVSFTMTPPNLTSISPTSVLPGTQVTFTGSGFGATQGGGTANFNNTVASIVSWSDTQVIATVAPGTLGGLASIAQNGVRSNGISFTMTPPNLTAISPTSVLPGQRVTFTGTGFGATQGGGAVTFNNQNAASIVSWSDTQVVATVASGTTGGLAAVAQNGARSNGISFTIAPNPSITSFAPASGAVGAAITITGANFGSAQNNSTVGFNGTLATSITNWSSASITATVPSGATTGNLVVTLGTVASNGINFTVLPSPSITSLSPTTGAAGAAVTISGANFGSAQGSGSVQFNGTSANVTAWNAASVAVTVPTGATTGNVVVYASGVNSNGIGFTVSATGLTISLSTTSAPVGTFVVISGNNFGTVRGSVTFSGTTAPIIGWDNRAIVVQVPSGASSGPVQAIIGGTASNTVMFTVTQAGPIIVALSETVGMVGDTVTITGTAFGTSGTISIGGVPASASSWSTSNIVTQIPAGAQTGTVSLTTAGQTSNSMPLTVVAPATITAVSPSSGDVGTVVTITGTNFGAFPSAPAVVFNRIAVAPTSWTNTQIVTAVPKGTTSGSLAVRVGNSLSNSATFTIVPTGSQVLSIFPVSQTLFVGQTVNLMLSDQLEHNIVGATWALSDNSLASLSGTIPQCLQR